MNGSTVGRFYLQYICCMETFVNKVADSGLITIDLEKFFPVEEVATFDMKDYLFMGLILKEKDFREALKNTDIKVFEGKIVAITCSADAVIPMWAYMLVTALIQPVSIAVTFGTPDQVKQQLLVDKINNIDVSAYQNQRIVIKGCGELPVGEAAYVAITQKLRPVAKSIMYGEPCSTVPVFKSKG